MRKKPKQMFRLFSAGQTLAAGKIDAPRKQTGQAKTRFLVAAEPNGEMSREIPDVFAHLT